MNQFCLNRCAIMRSLPYILLLTTLVRANTKKTEDSLPAESHSHSHHSHSHHHGHDSHHDSHPYKARILIKKIHVPVAVEKKVPVPVEKCVPVPMKVLVPYPIPIQKLVPEPYKVFIKVPTPVYRRFPVEKLVPVPVKVPYDQPVPVRVFVPYPIRIEKNIPIVVRIPVPHPYPVQKEVRVPYDVPVHTFPGFPEYDTNPEHNQIPQQNEYPPQPAGQPENNGDESTTENEAFENFDKSQIYQMIIKQLTEENSEQNPPNQNFEHQPQNLDVPVEQKLVVSEHNFDQKPFHPTYIMSFNTGDQGQTTEDSEAERVNVQSTADHYEGFDPSTVFEKKNNEYHQHLTENFDATKLFDQSNQA